MSNAWDADNSPITNTNATTTGTKTKPEICQRTGFRQLPVWHPDSKFVQDGYGEWVREKSADSVHPQDKIRSKGNAPTQGPQFAEPDNTFISTTVTAEDL